MNNRVLMEPNFKEDLMSSMKQWIENQRRFTDINGWWDGYTKKQIKHLFCRKGAEKKKDEEAYVNFLHTCIYEVLQSDRDQRMKTAALNRCKAEILLIHKRRMEKINLNTHKHATQPNERTSLYQLINAKRRRASTMIGRITNGDGTEETTTHGIMRVFKQHM